MMRGQRTGRSPKGGDATQFPSRQLDPKGTRDVLPPSGERHEWPPTNDRYLRISLKNSEI